MYETQKTAENPSAVDKCPLKVYICFYIHCLEMHTFVWSHQQVHGFL